MGQSFISLSVVMMFMIAKLYLHLEISSSEFMLKVGNFVWLEFFPPL